MRHYNYAMWNSPQKVFLHELKSNSISLENWSCKLACSLMRDYQNNQSLPAFLAEAVSLHDLISIKKGFIFSETIRYLTGDPLIPILIYTACENNAYFMNLKQTFWKLKFEISQYSSSHKLIIKFVARLEKYWKLHSFNILFGRHRFSHLYVI